MSRYISSVKQKKNGKTTKVKMAFGQIRPNDIENNGKKLGAPDTRKRVLFTGYPGGDAYSTPSLFYDGNMKYLRHIGADFFSAYPLRGVANNCIDPRIDGAVDI